MHVRSDRQYRFALPPDELWTAMAASDQYERWWPWLRSFEGGPLEAGVTWSCTVHPPLPYALRLDVHLIAVEAPDHVEAVIDGDIVGTASIEIRGAEGGSDLRLRSDLSPRNRVLQAVALAARPMVRFGHDWVLDTGARQFAERAI